MCIFIVTLFHSFVMDSFDSNVLSLLSLYFSFHFLVYHIPAFFSILLFWIHVFQTGPKLNTKASFLFLSNTNTGPNIF